MAYLPHTDADRRAMLEAVGLASTRELFATVPSQLLDPPIELPPPLGEQELVDDLARLAARNHPAGELDCFLGAGVYRRFIPAIVRATIGRPEFYTAYTPYQAEASQGTLQTIFEFQSMICALTGMDVANASLYDGATATAEGAILAAAHTGRDRLLVAADVHPETLRVLRTYTGGRGIGIDLLPTPSGAVDGASVAALAGESHAAVVVAQPSFCGTVADLEPVARAAHAAGALLVAAVDPLAQSALVPAGACGVDVAVGEAQQLGIPASFGGPHCGFIAARDTVLRRLPGRVVGMSVDHDGRRAYTLTLQTREQHIRREHATSNICTNHALMALAATAYMARMGAAGMRRVVEVSAQRAHHLADRLTALPGVELAFAAPWLHEFAVRLPVDATAFARALRERGIIAGLPLERVWGPAAADTLLVCCTETTAPQAIERYV
ncbi:MAG TPA: aminomethyl-transferring glycine dehydrogenase subunit GcvPA, partial [Candidatus Dormibacteraeota bacterium]|nr:aminomethyl-transferring glycine dehydrogenase subunit GcvPA [Candidatus Dormibacteraeota bacterium]